MLSDNERKRAMITKLNPSYSDVSYAESDLKQWQQNISEIDKNLLSKTTNHNTYQQQKELTV